MTQYIRVARIQKARKKQGRLVVRSVDGLPFLLSEGMEAYVVPPEFELPRCVTVASTEVTEAEAAITLEGISDFETLKGLEGKYLLVDEALVDATACASLDDLLRGYTVEDESFGALGSIVEVVENPLQAYITVSGPLGEVMIPFVDEFVLSIDQDLEHINVSVPKGLIDETQAEIIREAGEE